MCINGTFGFGVLDDEIRNTSVFMALNYCIKKVSAHANFQI